MPADIGEVDEKYASTRVRYLDEINILRYDQNPNVFLTSVGQNSGDMKLLTSGMLDLIHTFP